MTITPFAGTNFWLITTAFISLYALFQKCHANLRLRNSLMIGVSVKVISATVNNPTILLILLFMLTFIVFLTGNSLLKRKEKGTNTILVSTIVLVILFLCYFKYSIAQSFANGLIQNLLSTRPSIPSSSPYTLGQHIFFIGVSYFSFKFIHVLVECRNKKIKNFDFLTFINYTLFFPGFFSGPINRYNSFAESLATENKLSENLLNGIKRIITGFFKKIVLGDFFFPYSIVAINLSTATPAETLLGAYAYGLYIYFNFAGYTDMAIGCGKMVGIELPENFNYPFLKRNLQKFWANWHMSLTSWLTDYIYWPLVKKLRHSKLLKKKTVTLSNICIIITFIICGVWHGDGLNFFLWGLYQGVGLAILNLYTYFIKKYTSRKVKKFVAKSPLAYGISTIITFQYVVFGFFLFACDMDQLKTISTILF